MNDSFTIHEISFRKPKLPDTILIAYRAFSDLAGKGSLFVITVIAARRLSSQAFGIFSLASALGWMLAVGADFGIQLHVARAVARAPAEADGVLSTWLPVRVWTTSVAIAIVVLGLTVVRPPPTFAVPVFLFACVYGGSGLIEFLHYFYRGLSRSDVESTLTLWQRLATLCCGMIALAWRADVTVLAFAMLVPVIATLVASLRIARRLAVTGLAPALGGTFPAARLVSHATVGRIFSREVFPIGAGIVLSALYFRIDLLMVQLWRGTEAVALYNAVFRLVEALRLFPAAVLAVALPSLCRANDLRPLVRVSTGVVVFAIVVTAVLWATAGWTIPLLYGAHYAAAVPAFRILMLSFPLLSLNYALTHQLVGWDGQGAYAAICGLALVANVVSNARLIPARSIEGAAWATFGTELILSAGCLAALWTLGTRRAPVAAVQQATS